MKQTQRQQKKKKTTKKYDNVDQLLASAGTSRRKKPSAGRGYQWDHIVELQLVKDAVNRSSYGSNGRQTKKLIKYFQGDNNFQKLKTKENRAKSQAVTRLIEGKKQQKYDGSRINKVNKKWVSAVRPKLGNSGHKTFVRAMNGILAG